jgi:hypothetical protein
VSIDFRRYDVGKLTYSVLDSGLCLKLLSQSKCRRRCGRRCLKELAALADLPWYVK